MLKFASIVGYTSCGPTYIESFLTIFGQCINVLNYKYIYRERVHLFKDIQRTAGFYCGFIHALSITAYSQVNFMAIWYLLWGNQRALRAISWIWKRGFSRASAGEFNTPATLPADKCQLRITRVSIVEEKFPESGFQKPPRRVKYTGKHNGWGLLQIHPDYSQRFKDQVEITDMATIHCSRQCCSFCLTDKACG